MSITSRRGLLTVILATFHVALASGAEPQLEGSSEAGGLPGLDARATVLVGTQLETNREVLENHNMKLQEQIDVLNRQIKMVEAQLEEDTNVQKALQAQLSELQAGRGKTVNSMQASMIKASQDGAEAATKGFKNGSGLLQESAIEDGDDGEEVWDPMAANSERMERQYDMLLLQQEKVKAAMEHTRLTIEKLEADKKLHNVLKEAIDSQVDVLVKGRKATIEDMYSAMTKTAEAGTIKEATSTTQEAAPDVEVQPEVAETTTTQKVELESEVVENEAVTTTTTAAG